ncbi:uncharacterized protein TRIVIDRAFT_216912 [Trichoderma virens Gv29-8]|uniref:Cysteine-rich transmembrane CYSTM domain-containing protein n=1 Tax=Hypocrea virens (strain Gv29-8 / FGSC 10586) TaxID=413071 RepID=G9N833_HYPVG|nr:uncharacterized protein TRIVIDRAFT_216912 [Trichoderma virens Gv29-8]EHK17144.1 hypothetical protein TRIVIDRAFT_216912 [Trichoderma virens Gv29-8]UKZ55561.1 hypothetical protein TrVGV298_009385 [Trichoderma virens]UKZ81328.1 hypothetical protein TrVFT333_009100 [Trichoderma virens FT-333]
MSSPQPQMVAQQMTAEAPARISSEQPRPVQPMAMETTANMRGGEGEKGAICCGICAGLACFECCECTEDCCECLCC